MSEKPSEGRPLLALLLWDAGLPLAAYYGMRAAGASERFALLAGAGFAAVRIAWVAIRHRSFDGFAALLATVLGVGLILSFVTGDPKFLLVKESFSTAAASIILFVSCFTSKPLVLVAVRAGSSAAKRAEIDQLCVDVPEFKRSFVLMSGVWAAGLMAEAVVRVPLVYLLSADVMIALSLVLLVAVIGLLSAWTAWYAGRVQARYVGPDVVAASPQEGAVDQNGPVSSSR